MANKTAKEKNKPPRKTLKPNEYYNPKTKRFEYRYHDNLGKLKVISSYRLTPDDQLPKGKRSGKSLREKENEIALYLEAGLDFEGGVITLAELVERYLTYLYGRKDLTHNTKTGYKVALNELKQQSLGHMRIKDIRQEHCEKWFSDMRKSYKGSTIQPRISLIKRSFEYAVDHDYILKNPFRNIVASKKDSRPMEALTLSDMCRFLAFCRNDSRSAHCYDMINVLFWTGLRASELCGLTIDDIDLENKTIRVDKQLLCINKKHVVVPTKTESGKRIIPMLETVEESIDAVLRNRYLKGDLEPVCFDEKGNAYSGFLFLATRSRKTIVRSHVEEYLVNCIKRFNAEHADDPIRKFEPHICRHTFATNMQDLPPKTLQYILGHRNIQTTMNHYVSAKSSQEQLEEMTAIANRFSNS